MQSLLECNHVFYSYHTPAGETPALSDVSFTVRDGEFAVIVGPSGCGKSTLLSLLCSLLAPESGSILLNGRELGRHTDFHIGYMPQKDQLFEWRNIYGLSLLCSLLAPESGSILLNGRELGRHTDFHIGYMPQKDQLFEWRNIYGNITLGLEIQHQMTSENLVLAEKLMREYGLWEFRHVKPSQLSGGMRQRAALIRTLVLQPSLLLLDEPFSALDYQTRLSVSDDIYQIIKKEHKTAILVTHDLGEAVSMAELLDEPFSALDYQTRLSVSDDIYQIIKKEHKTAILVTHDLGEAVSMADKILVLSRRPATVIAEIPIELGISDRTPIKSRNAAPFKDYFNQIWKELNEHA